jgi:dienelactone hydrolase
MTALMLGCAREPASAVNGGGGGDGGASNLDAATPGATSDLGAQQPADLATAGLLYDTDGPEPYQQMQMTATGSGKSIPIVVYLPSTAGPRPLVVLSSGLQQPAAAYAPYARRLASWGILTVLRDDPGLLAQSPSVADDLAFIVGWLPGALAGRVDGAHVGLAGHSRGGMASLLAAEGALAGKLAGFCGLDPVDNNGGAAATLGSIGIPSLFLGETTDDGSGGGGMACAPADQNYQVLYAAAPSPSVEITAVGADHTQFEDPQSCSFCTLCTQGSADGAVVLRYATRYLTAFFARELLGDTRVGAHFEAAGLPDDVAAGRVTTQSK